NEPDYFELAPETTWRELPDGQLIANGYARVFGALGDETQKPFVAHGVGLSVGSNGSADRTRRRRWLDRPALHHPGLAFRCYTDHLRISSLAGMAVMLPLAMPMTPRAAAAVRRSLRGLQQICPDVGVENSVPYFFIGDARDEPAFLAQATSG